MKKLSLVVLLFLVKYTYAQVGIGTDSPNISAQLELLSSDKGLLIPRLELTSTLDASTVTNGNVESLLIYNTTVISDVTKGFYYWEGDKWEKILNESAIKDLLVSLNITPTSLYTEAFTETGTTPIAHKLTKIVAELSSTSNYFKVSLNGSTVSPSMVTFNSVDNTIQLTGISVYKYDVVTVQYLIIKM